MIGRSTTVSISLGMALVAGKNRVPSPATGKTALRIGFMIMRSEKVGRRYPTSARATASLRRIRHAIQSWSVVAGPQARWLAGFRPGDERSKARHPVLDRSPGFGQKGMA